MMEHELATTAAHAVQEPGVLTPDATMLILTWFSFISLLVILHKFAWKPILTALQAREDSIRQAVETAEKAKEELAKIKETRESILAEAESKAKDIIDESRKAAVEAAKVIQQKTKEENMIISQNAVREIKEETERARASLRTEMANIAVSLAGKLVEANIDENKNKKIIDEFIRGI